MKKVFLLVVGVVCIGSYAFAQSSQSLQLSASSTKLAVIAAPSSLADGTTTFTLDSVSSVIVTDNNINAYAWILGGNTFDGSPTNNLLGTFSNTPFSLITNNTTRMSIAATGGVTISGDLDGINGLTGYNWPVAHAAGFLQNNGTGTLSWQSSLQASRAGIGTWYKNNYGTGNQIIDVAGTDLPTIVPPFAGGLSGVSMKINPPCTGGTLIATVTQNGAATGLTVIINTIGDSFAFTDISGTPINFAAGDEIGVTVNDPGGFAPNTDILVTIFANF